MKLTDRFRRKIRKSWGWQPDLGNRAAAPNYWVHKENGADS